MAPPPLSSPAGVPACLKALDRIACRNTSSRAALGRISTSTSVPRRHRRAVSSTVESKPKTRADDMFLDQNLIVRVALVTNSIQYESTCRFCRVSENKEACRSVNGEWVMLPNAVPSQIKASADIRKRHGRSLLCRWLGRRVDQCIQLVQCSSTILTFLFGS